MTTNQPTPPSNPAPQNSEPQTPESVPAQPRNLQEENTRLKEENTRLREQLNNLDVIEELLVYRVAEKSQNKILGLAVASATIFSALLVLLGEGIIKDSAKNYIENAVPTNVLENKIDELLASEDFRKKIADKTAEKIIPNDKLIEKIADKVASILAEQQQFKIEGEVEAQVKTQLAQAAKRAEETNPQVANALQPSISEPVYFVVAGSSPKKSDLESELGRVKKLLGNDSLFEDKGLYSETEICSPKKGTRFFALVIAEKKTLSEAIGIVERAKKDGFRQDTYQLRGDRAFFNCPS